MYKCSLYLAVDNGRSLSRSYALTVLYSAIVQLGENPASFLLRPSVWTSDTVCNGSE